MFSAEDAKEVFQLLALEGDLSNPLILSSRDDGFVTRAHTRQAFEDLVTKVYATQRVSTLSLARSLDVSVETIRILAGTCDNTLLLRGGNGHENIISRSQKDAIEQDLAFGVVNGVISKDTFARKHDLSHDSLDLLIDLSELQIVEVNGYLYSASYELTASEAVATTLKDHLQKLEAITLKSTDVPGNPPTWFIHRTVISLLEDQEFAGKLHVHGLPDGVRCTPVQLVKQAHDTAIKDLQSGKTAYIDLREFQNDTQAIYPSVKEAQAFLESTEFVELVETFAISTAWISNFSKERSSGLAQNGGVEIRLPLKATFPDSLLKAVIDKVEQEIRANSQKIYRFGDCILSEHGYTQDRDILLGLAKADAASQWQRSKEDSKTDIKFSLSSIVDQIPNTGLALQDLVKERTVERALDDAFDAELSDLERQNEAEFADFWTDRIVTRAAIYSEGLIAVEDQKLLGQLSELLAQYIQKDLLPDAVSKATAQGLVLSRRTRKNIQKLESALGAGSMDVPALTTSLDKFNKKQSIDAPAVSALISSKETMLSDMARRMQKQKKSDGPLLFLTLVVFLFAKQNVGVIYATGKFAPKLLKQLKAVLDAEKYAQLEAWKEAAKAGTLSAEDRDGMKKMVEAGE